MTYDEYKEKTKQLKQHELLEIGLYNDIEISLENALNVFSENGEKIKVPFHNHQYSILESVLYELWLKDETHTSISYLSDHLCLKLNEYSPKELENWNVGELLTEIIDEMS